jgi:PAS domain S-box-containing protein
MTIRSPKTFDISCYSSWQMTSDDSFGAREGTGLDESSAVLCLLEASQIALFTVDSALEVTSWSPAAKLIFGWEENEIIGRRISLLAPDGSLEEPLASVRDQQGKHFESSCRTKAGETVLVDIWTCTIPPTNHRQLVMIRDVTELKFLEHAFLDAAEREQRKIGREMHDYLCQHILGAAFAVKALAGDLDREGSRHAGQLHDLARLVNESVTQVRDISRDLHPVELESGGLAAALKGLAARVSHMVPCEFRCEENAPIDAAPALHAYRIAQEAVVHASQETGATKISIRLSEKGGSIRLDITDDGMKEGPLTTDPDHLASKTLRYRAQAIHGHLRVKFHSRVGTHVTCTFPTHHELQQDEQLFRTAQETRSDRR